VIKKVLVTGSAGFIGYHLSRRLVGKSEFDVVGIDNFSRYEPDPLYKSLMSFDNFTHIDIDLSNPESLATLGSFDYVFHLAALNGTTNFYERPLQVIKSGFLPTLNIIEHFSKFPPSKFVYAGTSESYAGAVDLFNFRVPTPEWVPLVIPDVMNPRWSYAAAKSLSEVTVAAGAQTYNFIFNIVRFHNVYGPRMGYSHVIPEIISRAREGDFRVFGSRNKRSFIYIEDAVDALLLLLSDKSLEGEIVNIGTQDSICIEDLVKIIYKKLKIESEIIALDAPEGSVSNRCPDTTKLASIGFKRNFTLDEGLDLTLDYYAK
jgi:UDP-glucose 4-epimerase